MTPIRTLLVDDSKEFLEAAQRFLSPNPIITIVGLSTSGQDALKRIKALQPDLVLMDLAMPGINGLEVTRRIKTENLSPCVIILTLHDNEEYRLASESVGADGFIGKSDFGVELIPMIQNLFQGKSVPEPS